MNAEECKRLKEDADGLISYECLANNIETLADDLDMVVENMMRVDLTGQFTASAARYLHAIDPERFDAAIRRLVAATIDKDREHRYLGDVLQGVYGPDYAERADQLQADDNFRRIYKRLYPNPDSL